MKQKMTEHKPLTLKEVLKRHLRNKKDKKLHSFIDSGGRKGAETDFEEILKKASKPSKP